MPGNPPILSFAREPLPPGDPTWRAAAMALQAMAWLFVASAAWSTGFLLWVAYRGLGSLPGGWGLTQALAGVGLLGALASLVGLPLMLAWWASYAYGHWRRLDRRGYSNAVWVGAFTLLLGLGIPVTALRGAEAWREWVLPVLGAAQVLLGLAVVVACCLPRVRARFGKGAAASGGPEAT